MSTRSTIIARTSDGKYASIYCHWDGYPEHVGKILLENYTTNRKIGELIALGDLSSLQKDIGVKHPFNVPHGDDYLKLQREYDAKYGHMCLAYGRDRGEVDTEAKTFDTAEDAWQDASGVDYIYIWNGSQWLVGDESTGVDGARPVRDVLREIEKDEEE